MRDECCKQVSVLCRLSRRRPPRGEVDGAASRVSSFSFTVIFQAALAELDLF